MTEPTATPAMDADAAASLDGECAAAQVRVSADGLSLAERKLNPMDVSSHMWDEPLGQSHNAEPRLDDNNKHRDSAGRDSAIASSGISTHPLVRERKSQTESYSISAALDAATTAEELVSPLLIKTRSSPSLLETNDPMALRRTHSEAAAIAAAGHRIREEREQPQRPTLGSDSSSVQSDDGAASVASVAPTPTPAPAPPTVKSNSYKSGGRDTSLRIFFPTDDLAMKAILSLPTLRGSVSTPNVRQAAGPTLAESFLETTSRLFFLRGAGATTTTTANRNSDQAAAAATKEAQTAGDAQTAILPLRARHSTASMALEEDLSRLDSTIVATNPNLPPPPFANMFSCESCREDIGSLLTQGRHHCRNCGGSYCAACSAKTAVVPYQLYLSKGEQRVCDGCFNRIRDFHAQVQTTQVTWSGLPPPPSEQLTREFDLPPHETPVTVFGCSYFVDFAPFYGHLFLTREHACFRGYKTHKIKIAFADLLSLIKPEFYYINALQINTKSAKEKHFFAEFNGLRDLCFLRMDQLVRAFQEAKKKELKMAAPLSSEVLKQQAMGRRRSYKLLANQVSSSRGDSELAGFLAGSAEGYMDLDDEDDDEASDKQSHVAFSEDHDEDMSTTSSASDDGEPQPPDALLPKMTLLLDCELRMDTQSVFDLLWSDGHGKAFLRDHMEQTKDIDIDIEDWQEITSENEAATAAGFAISKECDYTHFRNVRSQHPPKTKFPGLPQYAGCCRLQRLRVEKSPDGSRWTRFVVSDLLRMSGIPFSDYFEIESRWVFTRDGRHYCHVQAGLLVNFIKSTWFKSQIDSSTRSESKDGQELWAKNAILYLQEHGTSVPLRHLLPSGSPKPASSASDEFEVSEQTRRRPSVSSGRSRQGSAKIALAVSPPPTTTNSSLSLMDPVMLLSTPQSLVQLVTLMVVLYCVFLIRSQQSRLRELSETTAFLTARLHAGSVDGAAGRGICEQSIVDGAVASLNEFFKAHTETHH